MESQVLPKGVNPDFVVLFDGVYCDICVICRIVTNVRTYCPIEQRKHYVEGCGQLCEDCYDKADFMI